MENDIIVPDFQELTFEEKNHVYRLNGVEVPSVTTLMKPLSDKVYGAVDASVLSNAAERGTSIHDSCENYALYGIEDVEPEYEGYFAAFRSWYEKERPVVLATERKVYHRMLGYAGMSDLLCSINGQIVLVDYKTTAQVNSMLHMVQLEAYARAWESQGLRIDDKMVLHLRKDGKYKAYHYPKNAECWAVMTALVTINNYVNKF